MATTSDQQRSFDISVIVTFHNEGRVAHRTFKSLERAVRHAEQNGKSVELIAILDKVTDPILNEAVNKWSERLSPRVSAHQVQLGRPALSRNYGVERSRGQFITLLDGDDLYGEWWLSLAHDVVVRDENLVAHPEFLFHFPVEAHLLRYNPDKRAFLDLIWRNRWCVISMAHWNIFSQVPSVPNDENFAFQDWLWNCETVAAGYQHVLVPDTVAAHRQKPIVRSLWQTNFMTGKVVRPNLLYKKILSGEYSHLLESSRKTGFLKLIPRSLETSLSRRRQKIAEHLFRKHRLLFEITVASKNSLHKLSERAKNRNSDPDEVPHSVLRQLRELSHLEPTLESVERPTVVRPGTGFRLARAVTPAMAKLVKAGKPKIFLLPNLSGNYVVVNALCYIHAAEDPTFVITTEESPNSWVELLPRGATHIDLGNVDLDREERIRLLHRLLLETDSDYLHVMHSEMTFEILDRAPGSFHDRRVLASFFTGSGSGHPTGVGPELTRYPDLLDFIAGISTDTSAYAHCLSEIFGVEFPVLQYHQMPFFPAFMPKLFAPGESHDPRENTSKPGSALRCACVGSCAGADFGRAIRAIRDLRQEGIDFHLDLYNFGSTALSGFFSCLTSMKGIRRGVPLGPKRPFSTNEYSVFVHPFSSLEAPIVPIQVMGNGIPLIAVDGPGIRDLVNEENGWIVDNEKGAEGVKEVLREIAGNNDTIHARGARAKEFIETNYSWARFKNAASSFFKGTKRVLKDGPIARTAQE